MEKFLLFSVALLFSVHQIYAVDWDFKTPLDEYVHGDDGYYSWEEIASYNYPGVTEYIINMTSQKWQDETFSTQPIWWHIMGVAIPDNLLYLDTALLFIDGGGNNINARPPEMNDGSTFAMAVVANNTGMIAAYLKQTPNQPIVFANDITQRSRSEDSIIAWTWRTFIDTPEDPDPSIILRMPMTKGAKRALDTITAVTQQRVPHTDVQRFVVTGASKRGWTTWSIAATDRRVIAIAPMVFSMIKMEETVMKHFQNMDGAWSFALDSYYRENLTQEFFNSKTDGVWAVEDMYNYRERFTLPILEIVGTGDEFFLADDNWNWWHDIPDPKYLLMLPNAEHSMAPHYLKIYETAVSFVQSILNDIPFPSLTWEMTQSEDGRSGSILFHTDIPPKEITAYSAVTLGNDTTNRRDFRLAALDANGDIALHPVWWRQNLDVVDLGGGDYEVTAEVVEGEWVGFFVSGTWEGPAGYRMIFTSQTNIIPNTYPHGPCTGSEECWGVLV